MSTRFHKTLKVIASNANGINRQRHEFSKQPYSQRHISNLMRGSVFQITTFIEQTAFRVERTELQ